MQELQLLTGVSGALAQSVDILGQALKLGHLPGEFGEGVVRCVWLSLESHVATVVVELPDESWIASEGARGGEGGCIVRTPETAGAAEGW